MAPKAYGLLSGDTRALHIGGAEVQQCLIARGLAGRGHAVAMVTLDVGQADGRSCDGVLAFRSYRLGDGLPGLRFFWPRMMRLWTAMERADATTYYQRTSDSLTGLVAAFCRVRRRRFVFSVGEDGDCLPSLPNCATRRERTLYRWGLGRADVVVAQTRGQAQMLREHFGRTSVLIRSAAPDPGEPSVIPDGDRPRFVWVGRLAAQKRPEMLLELARRCPDADFDVVGARSSGEPAAAFAAAAAEVSNVHVHGFVQHAEVGLFYDRATALLCTSAREGFPNTFLEAWSRGRPVLTTVDPDGVVAREGVGLVAENVEGLEDAVHCYGTRREQWRAMARRARAYYLREHRPARILDDYESLLKAVGPPGDPCSR
ncbi:MAG TPA: glycosyltransferase family 4 protein [Vicinamibacteria bacterium]|nr:glycosyltransferase family 4 protein [Vicinamibacteria bacterium]